MIRTRYLSQVAALSCLLAACTEDNASAPSTTLTFEEVTLASTGTLTGESTAPALEREGVRFTSTFHAEYVISGGFSLSTLTDTTTVGFQNALSTSLQTSAKARALASALAGSMWTSLRSPPFARSSFHSNLRM